MARATASSLNAQRSSIDPPPRPTMTTSTPSMRGDRRSARAMSRGRALALHARRRDDDVGVRIAAPQHPDDVAQRRAVERGDDADAARQRRQRPLARLVEQALGGQPVAQLLEGQLQRAQPARLHVLADQLVLAARVVDAEPAAGHDVHAVLGLEAQQLQRRAEHHALHLRVGVLEGEVEVAGVPDPGARELAFDPDLGEARLDQVAQRGGELAHRDDAAHGGALPAAVRRRAGRCRGSRARDPGRRRGRHARRARRRYRLSRSMASGAAGGRIGGDRPRRAAGDPRWPSRTASAGR